MTVVSRPRETTLEPRDFLLGADGHPMIFDSEEAARAWLNDAGVSPEEIETLNFETIYDDK